MNTKPGSEAKDIRTLGYDELLTRATESFRRAESTRADVLLVEHGGGKAVLKDYTRSSKGFSFLLAPYLVRKETRALELLDGIDGVPALYGKINRRAFLMEHLEATRIRSVVEDIDKDQFVMNVESLVQKLHENGVAHGDLRNATNIMVDSKNQPVFVDFGSAFNRGHPLNPISFWLFSMCKRIDRGAISKLKQKYAPELLNTLEIEQSKNPGMVERIARFVSVHGRNIIQKIFP